MLERSTALLVLGLLQVDGACLTLTPGATGTNCQALSQCTDEAPNNKGACKSKVITDYYCDDFADELNTTACNACTCLATCEADGGDGTPMNWRPGKSNPYGNATVANGIQALSSTQQEDLVKQHNFVRGYHGACPLVWDDAIAANIATVAPTEWASCQAVNSVAGTRAAGSPGGWKSLGENVVAQQSMYGATQFPVAQKTMAWYLLGTGAWDYANGAPNSGVTVDLSAFAQVLWKATTHVGCQMYQCDYSGGKEVLLVCQYGVAADSASTSASQENVKEGSTTATGCGNCVGVPTLAPTVSFPTKNPASSEPTMRPHSSPPTLRPSGPGDTSFPSVSPIKDTTSPSMGPTTLPPTMQPSTSAPSLMPSKPGETSPPSKSPTAFPSGSPSKGPSASPRTPAPTAGPLKPTFSPTTPGVTNAPSHAPTTGMPTHHPSRPGATPWPTSSPTYKVVSAATVQAALEGLRTAGTEIQSSSGSVHSVESSASSLNATTGLITVQVVFSGNFLQFDAGARNAATALIATELGISPDRLIIVAVNPGSVVVVFQLTNGMTVAAGPSGDTTGVDTVAIVVPVVIGAVVIITTVLLLVFCTDYCANCCESTPEDKSRDFDPEGEGEGEGERATEEELAEAAEGEHIPYGGDRSGAHIDDTA